MAISTYKTFLMHKPATGSSTNWTKLIDITSFGDLGGKPESLETTTLSNKMKTYIAGIQDMEAMEFGANYTKDDYDTVKALEGKDEKYAVWFGGTEATGGALTPTGSEGKYECTGQLSVFINGGGVNEVVKMTVSIMPSTDIVPSAS